MWLCIFSRMSRVTNNLCFSNNINLNTDCSELNILRLCYAFHLHLWYSHSTVAEYGCWTTLQTLHVFHHRYILISKMVHKQRRGWGLGTRLQNIVYPRHQNIEAWMVKPLSAGCVNTVVECFFHEFTFHCWPGPTKYFNKNFSQFTVSTHSQQLQRTNICG